MRPWEQPAGAYAGVGSRETPRDVLRLMSLVGIALRDLEWMCRTGGADGADEAFRSAATCLHQRSKLYLPWPLFNGHALGCDDCGLDRPTSRAYEIAALHHPGWARLTRGPRALHARNVHQVLGDDCASPAAFVLCWTPDGATEKTTAKTGGTGQAIRVAKAYDVPVYNLQREDHRALWSELAHRG